MVAAVSTTPNLKVTSRAANFQNPRRPLLAPPETENNAPPSRPKPREVTSRYLSSSISSSSSNSTSSTNTSSSYASSPRSSSFRRSESPMATRMSASIDPSVRILSTTKRSQSVEKRPTVGTKSEISNAARLLMTSTRSFSVSFQGESLHLSSRKAKPVPSPALSNKSTSVRKSTPERRIVATPVTDQSEKIKSTDHHRWPGRSKSSSSSILTRSLDYGNDKSKLRGSESVLKDLCKSLVYEDNNDIKSKAAAKDNSKITKIRNKIERADGENSASVSSAKSSATEDNDSVSSGGSFRQMRTIPRGIVVPARFLQESNTRPRKAIETPTLVWPGSKTMAPGMLIGAKKFSNESPVPSPNGGSASRGSSSPFRGSLRSTSPASRGMPSPIRTRSNVTNTPSNNASRGMPSPIRTRNGVTTISSNNVSNSTSILSFTADVKRGNVGENRVANAHELRLLYNRHLQWRYVNARAEASLLLQTDKAEKSLYNAWVTTSKLRNSVKSKRIQLQFLKQNLKLYSILKEQVPYLERWDPIDEDHSNSLSGIKDTIEANTVHLPLDNGAKAEIQQLNMAICSAADVMQGMASSICSQLTKVEQVNMLASELTKISANERALLDQCNGLLSSLTEMQVKDCSLRTHILLAKRDS